MLTLRQMDNIVQNDLFVIRGCEFERQEQGGSILYTIFINTDFGKLSLGKYRVWEWHDGSSRSGWTPIPENTNQEIEKLRSFILNMIITDASRAENNSIRDVLKTSQETIPLGLMLYKAAKDVIDMSPFSVMPELDSLSPTQKASRIIMSYSCSLAMPKDDSDMSNLGAFRLGFYDLVLPKFAASFLQQFPTPSSAKKKFPRIIRFSDFLSEDTRTMVEQILNLTVEEANALIKAKPLLENLRNDYLRSNVQISTIYQPAPQPATDYQPLPTNSSDELRVIQDSEAGTLLFKKDKQGGLVPQGGSINPGYDVVLVPKPFAFSGIAGPVQLPGSLAGQFETDLKSMEALINRLNTELGIGLAYHGQNDRTAVWSAGNCLIVTRAVDNRLTELELISFRREQSDATAGRTWKYLIDRLKGSGIPWQPIQDSERVAKKTLASFPPSRTAFKDDESFEAGKQVFEAERERRKNVTIEQAAKEILGVQLESELEDTTGWDITLMEMWNKGYSRDEIAQRVNVSKDRVTNRVTELRNKFGKERIPYDKDRKKLLIKS